MTDRLDDKIRSLMVQVVEASPAAQELEEIIELRLSPEPVLPATSFRLRSAVRPRRGWLVALGAAAVVLVVVGGVALLFPSTGSDSPAATTPPIGLPSSFTWSRVPDDESVFGGGRGVLMKSVTVGGPGLVAVGSDGNDGDGKDADAAVWTSVDGIAWSRVPHDEAVFGGTRGQRMNSVTAGGPGLVAVGSVDSVGNDGDVDAAVWTSVDGIAWSRVPHDEAVFGGAHEQWMNSVTAGGPGLVAVGSVGSEGDADAAVWTSVDGTTWSRVPDDEAVFGGVGDQVMNSVTVGGPGLVAVGVGAGRMTVDEGQVDWDPSAAVWTSVDGITWSRVPHDEAVFGEAGDQTMNSVTVGGPGLVAVGLEKFGDDVPSGRAFDAAVWTSVDGITWSRVPQDEAVFGGTGNQMMHSVTAQGAGLVAVGADGGFYATRSDAVVWTSVDGVTWSRVPHDEAVFGGSDMLSVTVAGTGLVAVGDESLGYNDVLSRREGIFSGDSVVVWVAERED